MGGEPDGSFYCLLSGGRIQPAPIAAPRFHGAPQDRSKNRFAFWRGPLNPLRIYERNTSVAGHRTGRDGMGGKDRRLSGRFFGDRRHDRIRAPFFRTIARVFYRLVHGRHGVFALRCSARQTLPALAGTGGTCTLCAGWRDLSQAHTRHDAGRSLRGRLRRPRHATPRLPPSACGIDRPHRCDGGPEGERLGIFLRPLAGRRECAGPRTFCRGFQLLVPLAEISRPLPPPLDVRHGPRRHFP